MNFSCGALFRMKPKVCLKYFVHDCIWKHFFLLLELFHGTVECFRCYWVLVLFCISGSKLKI